MKHRSTLLTAALAMAAMSVHAQQVPESGPAAESAPPQTAAIICPICQAKIIVASTTAAVIPPLRIESARPDRKTMVAESGPYVVPLPTTEPSSRERRERQERSRDTTVQIPEAGAAITPSAAPTPPRRRRPPAEEVVP